LLRLDASFHSAHTPGELIERVDGDVATLARFFSRFVVYVLGNGLLMLGVLGLLFRVHWRIRLGLSAFVVVAVPAILRTRAYAIPSSRPQSHARLVFSGCLGEYLSGLEDGRSSGAGEFVLRRWAGVMRTWLALTRRAQMRAYAMAATSQAMGALGIVATLA